ncbi:MAG: hypothetical protein NC244_08195 [Alistipes senegalensis]|nr:hypothetical protein [Alistipes senegalensis]
MKEYIVKIVNTKSNITSELSIFADEAETTDNIILKSNIKDKEICIADYNYFSAYQKFRDRLLDMNYGIKCKGSQINAFQSGMVGDCNKIYLVHIGQKALFKNIVSIYEYSDIKDFPDTKAQNDFSEKWFASII